MITVSSYPVEMRSTNRYATLDEAHRVALQPIAAAVAQAIRAGLACGRLVVVDGMVTLDHNLSELDSSLEDGV